MRRVGGGYNPAAAQDAEEALKEVAGLQSRLAHAAAEKDGAVHKAKASEASMQRTRQATQELADALIAAQAESRHLKTQLDATQAALAERGLGLDAAYERAAALEAKLEGDAAAQRAAERAVDSAHRDASSATARAAELERQVEVLTSALAERTSEMEKLHGSLHVAQHKEGLATSLADEMRATRHRDSEEATTRLGELEREMRRTMAEEGRRHESERQRLLSEVDAITRRSHTAEAEVVALREQVEGLRESLRLETSEGVRAAESARRQGDIRIEELTRDLELARRECSDAKSEARTQAARCEREVSEARRDRAEIARQIEDDFRSGLSTSARELEREKEASAEGRREAERKASQLAATAHRLAVLEESHSALEREREKERTHLGHEVDRVKAELSASQASHEAVERQLHAAESSAHSRQEGVRAAEGALVDAEARLVELRAEMDAQRHAALTAVDAEQRLRIGECEELRQQLHDVTSRLEDERSRRKEATRAALHSEGARKEAVAAEQKRRLQLENVARLERTARRDLIDERELLNSLLRTSGGDGVGAPSAGLARDYEAGATSPDASVDVSDHAEARRKVRVGTGTPSPPAACRESPTKAAKATGGRRGANASGSGGGCGCGGGSGSGGGGARRASGETGTTSKGSAAAAAREPDQYPRPSAHEYIDGGELRPPARSPFNVPAPADAPPPPPPPLRVVVDEPPVTSPVELLRAPVAEPPLPSSSLISNDAGEILALSTSGSTMGFSSVPPPMPLMPPPPPPSTILRPSDRGPAPFSAMMAGLAPAPANGSPFGSPCDAAADDMCYASSGGALAPSAAGWIAPPASEADDEYDENEDDEVRERYADGAEASTKTLQPKGARTSAASVVARFAAHRSGAPAASKAPPERATNIPRPSPRLTAAASTTAAARGADEAAAGKRKNVPPVEKAKAMKAKVGSAKR